MTLAYLKNKEVTAKIAKRAREILAANRTKPWGTTIFDTVDGEDLAFRIERHYHTPGGPIKPWGEHSGCSVLQVTVDEVATATAGEVRAFTLGKLSRSRLVGVDPRLVAVVEYAIQHTAVDFTVVEGKRTKERQAELVKRGASHTRNSRHLTGHAVDLAPWIGGKISWAWSDFYRLQPFIEAAAAAVKCPYEWGGNWPAVPGKSQPDGPHHQIPWPR